MNPDYENLLKQNKKNELEKIQKDIDRTGEAQSILATVPYLNEALKSYDIAKDGIDYDNLDTYTKNAFEEIKTNLNQGIDDVHGRAFDVFKESLSVYLENKKHFNDISIDLTDWINTFQDNQVNPKNIMRHALRHYSDDEDLRMELNYNIGIAFKTNYNNSSDYSYKEFTDSLKYLSTGNDKTKENHSNIFWNTYNLQKDKSSENHLKYFIEENAFWAESILKKISKINDEHKQYVISGNLKKINEISNTHQKQPDIIDLAKSVTKKIFDTGYFDEIISKGIEREGFISYISRQEGAVSTAFKGLVNASASIIKEGFDERQKHIKPDVKKSKSLKP